MANELFAFIDKAQVPSRDAWQSAIAETGFDLQLDPGMKPMEDTAYSPCTLRGSASGVEIYYEGDPAFLNDYSRIHQGRDYCISFRWGAGLDECACASIASYALAKQFGAVVSYEGEDPLGLEDLRSGAEQALDLFQKSG